MIPGWVHGERLQALASDGNFASSSNCLFQRGYVGGPALCVHMSPGAFDDGAENFGLAIAIICFGVRWGCLAMSPASSLIACRLHVIVTLNALANARWRPMWTAPDRIYDKRAMKLAAFGLFLIALIFRQRRELGMFVGVR